MVGAHKWISILVREKKKKSNKKKLEWREKRKEERSLKGVDQSEKKRGSREKGT